MKKVLIIGFLHRLTLSGGLLAGWVRYYNEERLHFALEYLHPVDYYLGNPQALLAERKTKLKEAASRRKEVNRGKKQIRLANGTAELRQSERGAETIADAYEDLTGTKEGCIILVPSACPKTTEPIHYENLFYRLTESR